MVKKKKQKEIRQNRPNYRKVRGYAHKAVRDKSGKIAKDNRGRTKLQRIKIKTKEWVKV